jgi:acyl-CoA synthetase
MTETNAHQYTRPDDDRSLIMGTCGRACTGYEVAIFDEDDPDIALPIGETGVVGGRGASLMLGYFDDQIATESAFNAEGWFLTGDLGRLDQNGYLRLTGRKKEVIIRGGHNINPARIEELALSLADVERAAAVPVEDARLGERVCLAVTLRPGAKGTADRVLDALAAAGLSRAEMPEFFLELDDIPLMSNGKIKKSDIVAWIRDGRVVPTAVAASSAR